MGLCWYMNSLILIKIRPSDYTAFTIRELENRTSYFWNRKQFTIIFFFFFSFHRGKLYRSHSIQSGHPKIISFNIKEILIIVFLRLFLSRSFTFHNLFLIKFSTRGDWVHPHQISGQHHTRACCQCVAIHRDLNKMKKWQNRNVVKFKNKYKMLHMGSASQGLGTDGQKSRKKWESRACPGNDKGYKY